MSYDVEFSEDGDRSYLRLNMRYPYLMKQVEDFIEKIAEAPTLYGRQVKSPPHPVGGVSAECDIDTGDRQYRLSVFFQYGADEQRIFIIGIGVV